MGRPRARIAAGETRCHHRRGAPEGTAAPGGRHPAGARPRARGGGCRRLGTEGTRGAADILALDPENGAEAPAAGAHAVHRGDVDSGLGEFPEHRGQRPARSLP